MKAPIFFKITPSSHSLMKNIKKTSEISIFRSKIYKKNLKTTFSQENVLIEQQRLLLIQTVFTISNNEELY